MNIIGKQPEGTLVHETANAKVYRSKDSEGRDIDNIYILVTKHFLSTIEGEHNRLVEPGDWWHWNNSEYIRLPETVLKEATEPSFLGKNLLRFEDFLFYLNEKFSREEYLELIPPNSGFGWGSIPVNMVEIAKICELCNWLNSKLEFTEPYIVNGLNDIKLVEGALTQKGFRVPITPEYYLGLNNLHKKLAGEAGFENSPIKGQYDRFVSHAQNTNSRPQPIDSKEPNDLGYVDLFGNMFNACQELSEEDKEKHLLPKFQKE